MFYAKQSTAKTCIVGPVLDSAGAEYASAVIGDLSISKNGGTLTAMASAATLTYIANGMYTLVMTTGNLDTLGTAEISCNKAGYQMRQKEFQVLPATVYDALVTNATTVAGGLGDIQRMAGTALTARDIGASVLLSSGTGTGQISLTSGTVDVGKWLGTACATPTVAGVPEVDVTHWIGTAAATPTTAGVPEVDVTFINGSAATGAGTPDVNVVQISGDATAANNAEAFFDGTGYAGTNNVIPVVTTVNGLAANVITATSIAADAITDAKVASDVTIASVTGAVGSVTGNVGGNVTGTVGSVVGAVGSVSGNVGGNVTGSVGSVATGGISSGSFAAGAIDSAAMNVNGSEFSSIPWNAAWDAEVQSEVQDAIEANHLDHLLAATYDPASKPGAADALLNELVGNDAGVSQFTANALELAPTGGSAPTVEAIRTEMDNNSTKLAAILTDTAEIGAAGAGLTNINLPNQTMDIVGNITGNLSGSVGSVTGAVTLPTIPVDWVTASGLATDAVTEIQSGLATAANLATLAGYVDTEVAAIKAKTDNLPTDPADQSAVEAAITAATSPLATAANLATLATYVDTEVAAILADTNELQTDWANGGRLDLLLDQALAAALLARQILGNKHTVQLNTPSAGLHTITVRNDDDTATVRTIVYNSATGARTVS